MSQAFIRNDVPLRIVLVGKTGTGKSATGNTILFSNIRKPFVSEKAFVAVTSHCKVASGVVGSREVIVVDTPGLFDNLRTEAITIKEIGKCIGLAVPGPHAFLIVIRVDRFTLEEQRSVEIIQKVFDEPSNKYTMVLFTHSDELEGKRVENELKKCPQLQELVNKCSGGYHVFNNKDRGSAQVNELLVKINQMVLNNGGSHYTNEMFQEAARKMQEEKAREDRAEVRGVITTTGACAAAGGCLAAAIETAVLAATTGGVGGPIGAALGGLLGFAIGGGVLLYKRRNR